MTYSFSCPVPCRRVILVDARNEADAIGKIIKAGALTCRNGGSHGPCDATRPVMPPLPDLQLREVVRLIIQAGDLPEIGSRD
ncbi:MAG: hypothetical protein ABFD62_12520 [Syntrophaceae bacterium]